MILDSSEKIYRHLIEVRNQIMKSIGTMQTRLDKSCNLCENTIRNINKKIEEESSTLIYISFVIKSFKRECLLDGKSKQLPLKDILSWVDAMDSKAASIQEHKICRDLRNIIEEFTR